MPTSKATKTAEPMIMPIRAPVEMELDRAVPCSGGMGLVAVGVGTSSVVAFGGNIVAMDINVVKVAVMPTERSLEMVVRGSVELGDVEGKTLLKNDVSRGASCDKLTDARTLPVFPVLSGIACRWTTETCISCCSGTAHIVEASSSMPMRRCVTLTVERLEDEMCHRVGKVSKFEMFRGSTGDISE